MALDRTQRKIVIIYALVLGLGLAYTAVIFITGWGMPCMFRELTGYECPGCGTSRMMLALMRLDIPTAFLYNPVAFVSLFTWVGISIAAFIGRPPALRTGKVLLPVLYVMITCYCIQMVIRDFVI